MSFDLFGGKNLKKPTKLKPMITSTMRSSEVLESRMTYVFLVELIFGLCSSEGSKLAATLLQAIHV